MEFGYQEEELVEVLEDQDTSSERSLVVYNDDFNTFEHVTKTLVRVCKHAEQQAEQCTYIIHFKGKCAVKEGTFGVLRPMKEAIGEAGIRAVIL